MSRNRIALLSALFIGGGISVILFGPIGAIFAGVVAIVAAALLWMVFG